MVLSGVELHQSKQTSLHARTCYKRLNLGDAHLWLVVRPRIPKLRHVVISGERFNIGKDET